MQNYLKFRTQWLLFIIDKDSPANPNNKDSCMSYAQYLGRQNIAEFALNTIKESYKVPQKYTWDLIKSSHVPLFSQINKTNKSPSEQYPRNQQTSIYEVWA